VKVRAAAITLSVSARKGAAERSGLVFTAGFYAIVVGVLGSLWRTAAGVHGGSVAGYSAAALTWYVATSEAATVALNARLIEDIGNDIASGAVEVELLRPASVLGVRVVTELGRSLPRLAVCVTSGVLLSVLSVGAPINAAALVLAGPSLVLAIVCNIVAMHAFAGSGFWLRDTRSAWFLYQKFVFLLGGMLIPLELLPGGLEHIARLLPFLAMAYAPARLASGHVEPSLLVVQAAWIVVLTAIALRVFAGGERRLAEVAG
jgi:ABC-2 type transport system permease protein